MYRASHYLIVRTGAFLAICSRSCRTSKDFLHEGSSSTSAGGFKVPLVIQIISSTEIVVSLAKTKKTETVLASSS